MEATIGLQSYYAAQKASYNTFFGDLVDHSVIINRIINCIFTSKWTVFLLAMLVMYFLPLYRCSATFTVGIQAWRPGRCSRLRDVSTTCTPLKNVNNDACNFVHILILAQVSSTSYSKISLALDQLNLLLLITAFELLEYIVFEHYVNVLWTNYASIPTSAPLHQRLLMCAFAFDPITGNPSYPMGRRLHP